MLLNTQDPEDRLIKTLLLSAAAALVVGFLVIATVIAVMISTNFNLLNWME